MRRLLILSCVLLSLPLHAQKVALVLSGGAAKGLAHVGVIKALEENDIPIDYIVGTSMGGIIGGSYAAGMSPYQIEDIVTSEDFLRLIRGLPREGFNYYYHKDADHPGFLKLDLSLDSTLNVQLNSSIANDVSLNFALTEIMAQASGISRNNFDSLFVPLRVVAADIFTQQEVILKRGLLSDALRATQTVPFFYKPIRVDGRYLFDGGVYNNFPVDVATKEFNPDIIIGVNVSTKIFTEYPYETDDRLISNSLIYMLLDKSDPTAIGDLGIYIQPNIRGYTSFDFERAESLIDSGYVATMRKMDEIKAKIARRVSCDELSERRNEFNNRGVPFIFDGIRYQGFTEKQTRYINRLFGIRPDRPRLLFYRDILSGYYELVSEEYFHNVVPSISLDTATNHFVLNLARRPQQNFQIDFGGVIATRNISNIFLGASFYRFNKSLLQTSVGFQTGSFYKSATARMRVDNPFITKFYIEPSVTFNSWDYLESEDLLQDVTATVLRRVNRKAAVDFGWPVGRHLKASIRVEGFSNLDRYSNDTTFTSTAILDELKIKGIKAGIGLSANDLDRKQYPRRGKAMSVAAEYFSLSEDYLPGNTAVNATPFYGRHNWFRLRLSAEQYFNGGFYHPGYIVEGVFSNQPSFQNYRGTIINAPTFHPLQDSRTLLLEKFRSFNYVAGGIRNIFVLKNKLDFRLETYLFKPLDYLSSDENQDVQKINDVTKAYLAASAGLVHHSPIGPINLSVNYYDDNHNKWGVLLHVGFLLFDRHSLE
ncbi:MAG TPA: patatin-like phospholipase family protein [Cyclobacteriaceae bacterium]|jgi:NTE family protein